MRKLATVRNVDQILPIEGADNIEIAVVGGWKVVVKKNEFKVGDLAVYVEIDSWVPVEIAPFLSRGNRPREFNGIKGERLRTVKLRGQLSQGLLLPASVFGETQVIFFNESNRWAIGIVVEDDFSEFIFEGDDVTDRLGIQKWEAPIPAQLAGQVRDNFPGFIPKTDQERVQNLVKEVTVWAGQNLTFEVTEKLDGSSMTVYDFDGECGVCSRNLELKESDTNSFWVVARREQILDKIKGMNIAIQGELIGAGIQGNKYALVGQDFYVFDIYDIKAGRYFTPSERREFCTSHQIKHVPVLTGCVDKDLGVGSVDEILVWAEDKSKLNTKAEREGIVFKCNENPSIHFKAISNKFLIKTRD